MGYYSGSGQRSASKRNAQKVLEWPPCTSLCGLRGFLKLANFYHNWVQLYAQITTQQLTKKGAKLVWLTDQQQAMYKVKKVITSEPVLKTMHRRVDLYPVFLSSLRFAVESKDVVWGDADPVFSGP